MRRTSAWSLVAGRTGYGGAGPVGQEDPLMTPEANMSMSHCSANMNMAYGMQRIFPPSPTVNEVSLSQFPRLHAHVSTTCIKHQIFV